jgi:hypothetical protein
MDQDWMLSTCFEHFGAVRSRRHFGGSAISDDGETVVVALWEDEMIRDHDNHITYQSRFGPTVKGKSKKISMQWISHLKWAVDHCNGCVRVVVLTAEDIWANPRVIRSCHPDDTLVLRITQLNAKTGCFQAQIP